jgi:ribosomal protein S18 acetylase RimI-like enzyme
MIRNYRNNDIDEIISIYTRENKLSLEEIEEIRNSKQILVYDNDGVKAYIRLEFFDGQTCDINMGFYSNGLIKPIGLKLWVEAKKLIKENATTLVNVCYIKNRYLEELFDEIGFENWFSYYKLKYNGGKYSEPVLNVKKYEDEYYIQEISLESESFSKLRKENNIAPHNWYLSASESTLEKHRKKRLLKRDNFYLFFEESEIVGAAIINNADINMLFVNVKYQGQGYGRKILEFAVNRGLEQNSNGVDIEVLANNEKALGLYTSTGFEIVQGYNNRRIHI